MPRKKTPCKAVALSEAEPEQTAAEDNQKKKAAMLAAMTPIDATLMLARRGNPQCLPRLRQVLDENHEMWQHFGNLTLQAQESWLKLIAGKDLYLSESLQRHLDDMRNDLAGPNPSALERLLIDRLLACHTQVLYFDAHEGQNPGGQNAKLDKYRLERQNLAHRQFLSAARTLAIVRQLSAKTATIQVEMIHRSVGESPMQPIIVGANGEQPRTCANAARTVNGYNRFGNRMEGMLDPITAGAEG